MKSAKESENKRKNLRVPILVTQVKGEYEGKVFFGYAKNISKVGLFIQTISPKERGATFKIEFTLPKSETMITCSAEVIWARNFISEALYEPGMGLKFIDLSETTAEIIDRWVSERLTDEA